MDRYYRRHLPHQIPENVPIFVTWNLKGALPKDVIERLRDEANRLQRQVPHAGESARDRQARESKILFGMADKVLDQAHSGPLHLEDPRAAKVVEDSIVFGAGGQAFQPDEVSRQPGKAEPDSRQPGKADLQSPGVLFGAVGQAFQPDDAPLRAGERYALYAWCVMANHVHVLLKPFWDFSKVMQGIKGYTAHQINGLHGARGRIFWQDESFDHWARDEEEMMRIIQYIENNPVAAGLCTQPEEWPWSSARFRASWPEGQPFQADVLTKWLSGWKA
jgi:REP element-mobilizing transposase RayT